MLAAVLLATGGLAVSAGAATARTLTVQATPNAALAGSAVTFSGTLSNTPTGSEVKIQRKSGLSWVKVASTVTTTAAGAYSLPVTLPTTAAAYSYRASAPWTSTRGSASSPTITVTALRPVTTTITATPATIVDGESSTLSGTVAPFVSGTVVTIEHLSGASWVAEGPATLTATGTFNKAVTPSVTTDYRVTVPRTGLNSDASSAPTTVSVGVAPVVTTTELPGGDQDVAYSATLTKAGQDGTWAVTAGALPAGITLDAATGQLSGTPTVSGTFAVTVTFTETISRLAGSKELSLEITPPPAITTASLPDATRATAYTATLAKSGFDGTWAATGLPAALSIDAATGVISGTPAELGDSSVAITFTETSTGRTASAALTLHVGGTALAVTTASLNDATKGQAYSATLTKTGEDGTWTVTGLPSGIAVNAATGVLSGTTQVVGDFALTATFTETATNTQATKALSLHVGGSALAITTSALPDATKGMAYSVTLTQNGGAGNWSSYPLPSGLVLNSTTGVISGTPTTSGDFSVYVGYTETATGKSAIRGFALHIAPSPVITTTSLPDGTTGTAYSKQLASTGQDGTWSITKGNLPAGVTLSTSGLLSGTPTAAGDFGFTVTFTETATGYSDNQVLLLHTSNPGAPVINTTSLPDGVVGTAYNTTLSATGTGTWTLTYGALPAGVSLNGTTGVISGTPTAAGDSLIQVRFTTATGFNTKVLNIHIAPAG